MSARILFACLLACGFQLAPTQTTPTPNIVIIFADDLGYGDIAP